MQLGGEYSYARNSPLCFMDRYGLQGERGDSVRPFDPLNVPFAPMPRQAARIDRAIEHARTVVDGLCRGCWCVQYTVYERLVLIREKSFIRVVNLREEIPATALPDYSSEHDIKNRDYSSGNYVDVFTEDVSGIELSTLALGEWSVAELASLLMHEAVHSMQSFVTVGPGGLQRAVAEIQATMLQLEFQEAQISMGLDEVYEGFPGGVVSTYRRHTMRYLYYWVNQIQCELGF